MDNNKVDECTTQEEKVNDWIIVSHKKNKNNGQIQPKSFFKTKSEQITFKKNGKIKIY
jgi:hypothetical protein